jgi:ribosomal protein S20
VPIIKSAIKRMKQTAKRRARNMSLKRDIKSATKAFLLKPSAELLSLAHSELDTAVKKNLLKANTAARRKAQLARIAKEAGVKLGTTKKAVAAKPAAAKTTKAAPVAKKAPVKKPAAKPAVKKPAAKKPAAKKATK